MSFGILVSVQKLGEFVSPDHVVGWMAAKQSDKNQVIQCINNHINQFLCHTV